MPKFQVLRRVDAYVDYIAEVEADSPAEAAELASDDETAYAWRSQGEVEFDTRLFIALDPNGHEVDGTQQGAF